ncbi:magnesium transporter [Haloechinothrix sp. LS1_15]|uniref:magnesium transporter n=1 Tax=Haloechinothrix sp. LS1_15 TaxID=2652248 RepID=UPI002944AB55|nr:magnesium transporter [Haloechinothrix sp. LS1_15]MDV6013820.1 magnesium transporter [Haloechinothrix sp. LS1_15]
MSILLVVSLALAAVLLVRARRRRVTCGARARRGPAMLLVVAIAGVATLTMTPTAAAQDSCEPPNPERPGSGMVGAIDPAEGRGEDGSAYLDYNYAGMVWHVYEMDCGPLPGIGDPNRTIDTWTGNQLFNLGKNIVGATNALHYTVMEGGLFAPLHDAIETGAEIVYNNIYAQLFGLVALLMAIMMFRHIWRGDLPAVSKRLLFALAAMWLAASSLAMLRFHDDIDRAIVQTTTNIQAGFVDEDEDRVARDVLPTALHTEIVYNNWLRGTFGSPDAPQAEEYGMRLLDAQAFTWAEIREGADADEEVVAAKQEEYERIAEELGPATGYFTGEDGSRTGAGFLAFLQSIVYALFQLFAKAAILLAQVVVRLLTLTAPLIGLAAMLHNDILRKVAKVAGAVVFNLVVLSVLAGVHALLLQAIFNAGPALSMMAQIAIAALVTILLFVVGKPARRLWQMVDMSTRTVGGALPAPSRGLFSRFRRRQHEPGPQDHFWRNVREDDQSEPAGGSNTGRRVRPEASVPVAATAQRLDRAGPAGAPGAGEAGGWQPAGAGGAAGSGGVSADGDRTPFAANPARLGYSPAGGLGSSTDGGSAARGGGAGGGSGYEQRHAARSDGRPRAGMDGGARPAPEGVVVPSQIGRTSTTPEAGGGIDSGPALRDRPTGAVHPPVRHESDAARRADTEVVGGRPVRVLYRPSRGLEVQQNRDTDTVVR